jgi:DNA modification methylase
MNDMSEGRLVRGFLFASTDKTEKECFDRSLFGTEKSYGPVVIRIRKGDLLFLNNLDSNSLYGIFKAVSDGGFNIQPEAWRGKYPYQVKIETLGEILALKNAEKTLSEFKINRNTPLFGRKLIDFLELFIPKATLLKSMSEIKENNLTRLVLEEEERIKKEIDEVDIDEEIPPIEATTLWDFPKQSYGLTPKGDNKYPGVTPALIIYNLVWRYTDPGDLVVDPMCGSGTTIDVCKEEKRRVIGYDISPVRPDIIQNDARKIPLEDNSVDLVFIDSPYGDNIRYNEHPDDIGKISSETEQFYDELEKVMKESHRMLKEGKILGWLIGDQWVKKEFTPVGIKIYDRLCKYFEPVDTICVTRRGQCSHTGLWYNRARRFNFYLRGFKYLFIMRKTSKKGSSEPRKIEWAHYPRGVKNRHE